jgi:hypothetical protein
MDSLCAVPESKEQHVLTCGRHAAGYYSSQPPRLNYPRPVEEQRSASSSAGPEVSIASPPTERDISNVHGRQSWVGKPPSLLDHRHPVVIVPKNASHSEPRSGIKKTSGTLEQVMEHRRYSETPATAQLQPRQRAVHWANSEQCKPGIQPRSISKLARYNPLYNEIRLTPAFTLYVKFDNVQRSIHYPPARFLANRLLDFELHLATQFPVDCRDRLRQALQEGYCLIMFSTGFKKRVPVYVRGPRSVHPEAAFTGLLNTVSQHATVLLEWESD